MRILGLDPGLRHTGWGVIISEGSRLIHVASGTISPPSSTDLPLAKRLVPLYEQLQAVIALHRPDVAAVEETFVNDNAQTSLKLGHARGTVLLAAALAGLEVHEYAPRLVKKAVVGVGKAEKQQVAMMVKCLLPSSSPDSPDAADALAVAICHSSHSAFHFALA
ncbi:MAG: crossover junction endodeoxyribonuclease RuvC [Rickettsiales bacterium]|nr:crossover junction endodeoxyribonuclease RuvC [Rickettsiales bacterium]